MTQDELKALEEVPTPHGKWWVPFVWTFNLIKDARNEGRIANDYMLKALMEEVHIYRGCVGMLYSYDWISIPLVYTQVTTLAVYTFFLGSVFGQQFLDPEQGYTGHDVDLYVPVFTILQFFFYMGWLKVAEQMINPFGEDDDDFDMNWIIDRNMQLSLLTVDDLHQSYPKLQKDVFFDEPAPDYLAYTKSAVGSITQPWLGSTANFNVSDEGMQVVTPPMDTIQEEPELPPPYSRVPSQLNVNSGATSPVTSPHPTRKNKGNLMNNMVGSLSGIRSTMNLSRGQLDNTGKTSINIGYVQGIDISRANLSRLTHSSRDLNRSSRDIHRSHLAVSSDHQNSSRDAARTLLQTLHGSRMVSHDSHHGAASGSGSNAVAMDSPMTDRSPVSRLRLDSLTSQNSMGNRPRSHCFVVEPVDDSVLDASTCSTPTPTTTTVPAYNNVSSAGQNSNNVGCGGLTNASFVIDMNTATTSTVTTTQDAKSDDNNGSNSQQQQHHHVEFNTIPEIITPQPESTDVVISGSSEPPSQPPQLPSTSGSLLTAEVEILEPLMEVVSDQNSSTESLSYIKPDPNQCTVTSLTPLLPSDSSDSEPELTPSGRTDVV